MRLVVVDSGHDQAEAAILAQIAQARGVPTASGVLKTLYYRPELFGRPFSAAHRRVERELFAGFVSSLNQCPF